MTVRRKSISAEVRKLAWNKTGGKCWYCGKDVTVHPEFYRNKPNIEHLKPVHQGGADDIENLVLACFRCNLNKRGRDLPTYRLDIGETWALSFEEAADDLKKLREIWGTSLGYGLDAVLRDIARFLRRANFSFYGEIHGKPEEPDYQI